MISEDASTNLEFNQNLNDSSNENLNLQKKRFSLLDGRDFLVDSRQISFGIGASGGKTKEQKVWNNDIILQRSDLRKTKKDNLIQAIDFQQEKQENKIVKTVIPKIESKKEAEEESFSIVFNESINKTPKSLSFPAR